MERNRYITRNSNMWNVDVVISFIVTNEIYLDGFLDYRICKSLYIL